MPLCNAGGHGPSHHDARQQRHDCPSDVIMLSDSEGDTPAFHQRRQPIKGCRRRASRRPVPEGQLHDDLSLGQSDVEPREQAPADFYGERAAHIKRDCRNAGGARAVERGHRCAQCTCGGSCSHNLDRWCMPSIIGSVVHEHDGSPIYLRCCCHNPFVSETVSRPICLFSAYLA